MFASRLGKLRSVWLGQIFPHQVCKRRVNPKAQHIKAASNFRIRALLLMVFCHAVRGLLLEDWLYVPMASSVAGNHGLMALSVYATTRGW